MIQSYSNPPARSYLATNPKTEPTPEKEVSQEPTPTEEYESARRPLMVGNDLDAYIAAYLREEGLNGPRPEPKKED